MGRLGLPPLPGRLADQGILIPTMLFEYPAGTRTDREVGLSGKSPEIGLGSVPGLCVLGEKIPVRHGNHPSTSGSRTKNGEPSISNISTVSDFSGAVEIISGNLGLNREQYTMLEETS